MINYQLDDCGPISSALRNCEYLIRKHSALMMRVGGGSIGRTMRMDRLRDDEVETIRARAADGASSVAIAREIGRSQTCVAANMRKMGFAPGRWRGIKST